MSVTVFFLGCHGDDKGEPPEVAGVYDWTLHHGTERCTFGDKEPLKFSGWTETYTIERSGASLTATSESYSLLTGKVDSDGKFTLLRERQGVEPYSYRSVYLETMATLTGKFKTTSWAGEWTHYDYWPNDQGECKRTGQFSGGKL